MAWKRKTTKKKTKERKIITGMIVSDRFLRGVVRMYRPEYMQMPFTRIVADWCVSYWNKYEKAPGENIKDVYDSFVKRLDSDDAESIAVFLRGLSEQFELEDDSTFNYEYWLDEAREYFDKRSAEILIERVQEDLDRDDVLSANQRIAGHKKVINDISTDVNPLTDAQVVNRAFSDEESNVLLRLPGAVGQLFGDLEREYLVGLSGAYKRGKTWWLLYLAIQSVYAGLKVAFYSFEMSERQMVRRFQRCIAGEPKEAGVYKIPIWDCLNNQTGECQLKKRKNRYTLYTTTGSKLDPEKKLEYDDAEHYRACTKCRGKKGSNYKSASWLMEKEFEGYKMQKALSHARDIEDFLKGKIRLQCWPAYSKSLHDVEAHLDILEYTKGFVPDVIITDYADILQPGIKTNQNRDALDYIWKKHKSMAQAHKALVITVTQAGGKEVLDRKTLKQKDVAEESRKLGHVDVLVGINQNEYEERDMVCRLNQMAMRDSKATRLKEVMVLSQSEIGQPCLDSEYII